MVIQRPLARRAMIGEDQLPQAGPEQIIESYYSITAFNFGSAAVDYQLVNNPAYNEQRGPVSVLVLRLNAEF